MAKRHAKVTWRSRIKRSWSEFQALPPGRRFQSYYRKAHGAGGLRAKNLLQIGLGLLLLIVGGIMLVIPGPGIPVVVAGAVLVARHVKPAAKSLDWIDVHARRVIRAGLREWREATVLLRSLMVAGGVAAAGAVAYGAVDLLLSP
jgi:hypothetical protein